jgi:hypothetical protein
MISHFHERERERERKKGKERRRKREGRRSTMWKSHLHLEWDGLLTSLYLLRRREAATRRERYMTTRIEYATAYIAEKRYPSLVHIHVRERERERAERERKEEREKSAKISLLNNRFYIEHVI